MVTFPPAKINLGLRIRRRRADGYHELESCLVPVRWCDLLEVMEADAFSFQTSGLSIPGDDKNNLCARAYQLLQPDFSLPPVQIYLHKIIPMGAGLGGGSSDAASMLTMLNEVFSLSLETSILENYAAQLGSDCPFFIRNQPRMAYGTGTTLEDIAIDLSGKHIVLVYPNVAVTTVKAYANVRPQERDTSLKEPLEMLPMVDWKEYIGNDFEESVFRQHPALADIKEELYQAGAVYASMSGSGSTVYGLFEESIELPTAWDAYSVWQGNF